MASLHDLTPREREILQLILAGKTNKEIAREAFISRKTVEWHIDNIYSKIGTRSRLTAGLWAVRQGLQTETRVNPG